MPTLQFKGKTFVQNHHLAAPYHQLVARPDLSITDRHSLHDNLVVRGDNLLALKALLPTYAGRVKCIYIDPPYNTGNEAWVYNDNVNAPMIQQWLGKVVDKEDLTRHDKWLCMMMPRLKLLWDLLAEDGAIFISIDDHEQHYLRALLDEIYGEENFIANVIWQKNFSPKNSAKYFSEDHDFIVVYAKNIQNWLPILLERTGEQLKMYQNPDGDPRGEWASSDLTARNPYSKGLYSIKTPGGRIIEGPPKGTYWRISEEKLWELNSEDRIWWGDDQLGIPRLKRYLTDVREGVIPRTIWLHSDAGNTQEAKKEVNTIFGDTEDFFQTPKPVSLLKKILKISTKNDDVILDSFAGSATTAQAVLELNQEDGGDRKFILVEMEEYADKLTAERVRRVIRGVPGAKSEALRQGLGGTFSYFELGEKIEYELIMDAAHRMPDFAELARYLFFHATGEQLDANGVRPDDFFVGESRQRVVYLKYRPDVDWLRKNGLTVSDLSDLPAPPEGKRRLVFAPLKYVDDETLREHRVDFHQLPYQIYRMAESK